MGWAFLLGFLLMLGIALLLEWFLRAKPASIARVVRVSGIVIAVLVALGLVLAGRRGLGLMMLGLALPFLLNWLRSRRARQGMDDAFTTQGRISEIETGLLRMQLNQDTGELSGVVLGGPFEGRSLDDLDDEELAALRREAARDRRSSRLLETWLYRHRPGWRDERTREEPEDDPRGEAIMTRAEALRLLGLEEGATRDAIQAAYRRLMAKLHPDAGGSDYLAAKLNEARSILLGGT